LLKNNLSNQKNKKAVLKLQPLKVTKDKPCLPLSS